MRPSPALAFVFVLALGAPQVATAQQTGAAESVAEAGAFDVADLVKRLKSKEGDVRLVAATQALEVADDAVTKPLARLLGDDEFGVRAAAIQALATRTTERGRRDAAKALVARMPRLAKAEYGEGELLLVIEALGELAQPSSVKPLFDGITDETSDEILEARMDAVAQIPHASAVEELIRYLARRGRGKWGGRKRAVTSALQAATGQRLGNDPDKWRAWWKENAKTFDFAAAAERRASESAERERRAEKKRNRKSGKKGGKGAD